METLGFLQWPSLRIQSLNLKPMPKSTSKHEHVDRSLFVYTWWRPSSFLRLPTGLRWGNTTMMRPRSKSWRWVVSLWTERNCVYVKLKHEMHIIRSIYRFKEYLNIHSYHQRTFVCWLKVNFNEIFVAWIHIKVLRTFVESVLR